MKAPRFNPKKLGIAFIVLAVIMFIVEQVWKPVFTLPITESFGFPVWILSAIYGALQVYIWQATQRHVPLTDAEIKQWGGQLEEATPKILELFQNTTRSVRLRSRLKRAMGFHLKSPFAISCPWGICKQASITAMIPRPLSLLRATR